MAMARVLALVPDLLFGSRLQGALTAAGHELELLGDEPQLRERLADRERPAQVLIVDLTDGGLDGASIVASLRGARELGEVRTLGFYSHVDAAARERAEQAGFDLVVPRSRINREGAELVTRLATP
jgi:DNA-binding NarL/FixJ family response regulator